MAATWTDLFVVIDRTSTFTVAQLVGKADLKTAREFLAHLLEAVLYEIHTIFADNRIQFAERPRNRDNPQNAFRLDLQREWYRASTDEAQPFMDERTGL